VIDGLFDDNFLPFRQILIELHVPKHNGPLHAQLRRHGFVLTRKEPNYNYHRLNHEYSLLRLTRGFFTSVVVDDPAITAMSAETVRNVQHVSPDRKVDNFPSSVNQFLSSEDQATMHSTKHSSATFAESLRSSPPSQEAVAELYTGGDNTQVMKNTAALPAQPFKSHVWRRHLKALRKSRGRSFANDQLLDGEQQRRAQVLLDTGGYLETLTSEEIVDPLSATMEGRQAVAAAFNSNCEVPRDTHAVRISFSG